MKTLTFSYTGAPQYWTPPEGVRWAIVDLLGGAGGFGSETSVAPGYGGRVRCKIVVVPFEDLQVNVGGRGTPTSGFPHNDFEPGGYNGGGSANNGGGSGGGASDVRRGAWGLADRLAVAPGGGGRGGFNSAGAGTGNGGTPNGGDGAAGAGTLPGLGATQFDGGAGPGGNGALGVGGPGGGGSALNREGGGGGGGGLYGGGGGGRNFASGYGSGGGGGAGLSTGVLEVIENGVNGGWGLVVIQFQPFVPPLRGRQRDDSRATRQKDSQQRSPRGTWPNAYL